MAESSLSISWVELKQEVGWFLNYGRSSWSADQTTEIENIVQSGVRRVYYPTVPGQTVGYEWSWLRPTTTLSIYAAYGTGTVTIASGVVTLAGGTFPSWAADGVLKVSGNTYEVSTRDGDTQITLVDTSVTLATATAYSIAQQDYTLPDDFGSMYSKLHWPEDEYRSPVERIPVGDLLALRARATRTGPPKWFAIRHKTSTGSTGQRQEMLLYPAPDVDKSMPYQYEAYSSKLSDTYPYPLGGMKLAELYTEACLAVAELRSNDEMGLHTQTFSALLLDAIQRDKKRAGLNYGHMGHRERHFPDFHRGYTGNVYPVTYKGSYL
jgi:hypothetical protein